jgi:hypothetical protein
MVNMVPFNTFIQFLMSPVVCCNSLSKLISSGQSVTIDEIGEFKSVPLFQNGVNHHNNIALAKAAKCNIISFKASREIN